ncbi:hypothetical protein OGAPHI_000138 [Ogataea philodendri]|uniref:Zn(2)-C6 fungal-type domain-containing protein n=1 Tax=Ogataea philodendri TaxID=1378263 RepID=A0A9P8PIK7_9ASCO|nr:uncharacterized protein OGAPHI_000138 [Ogataea philodendri]KAH3671952.1 hypothetical protein OGAPHI_000138 [Ogataea philodendri]
MGPKDENTTGSDASEQSTDAIHSAKMKNSATSKRRSVACKACHSLKVKCVPHDVNNPLGTCVRCWKNKRQCEFDLSQARKKKTPAGSTKLISKYQQLESKIADLQSMLEMKDDTITQQARTITNQQNLMASMDTPRTGNNHFRKNMSFSSNSPVSAGSDGKTHSSGGHNGFGNRPAIPSKEAQLQQFEKEIKFLESVSKEQAMCPASSIVGVAEDRIRFCKEDVNYYENDLITSGILSEAQCEHLFGLFVNKIYKHYPFILLPENLSLSAMRKEQPILLLVCSYLATIIDPEPSSVTIDVQLRLESLVSRTLTGEVLSIGDKSLSLVKSMLLYCIWYVPPELFHHRRYHMFNSLCVSMMHDLGLTGRPYFFYSKEDGAVKKKAAVAFEDPENLEGKGLLLLTYLNTVSISLFLRRRMPVQWSDYCEQCCSDLESTSDKRNTIIAIYARLNHILERIHFGIHSSMEQVYFAEHTENRQKYLVQEVQRTLNSLRQRISVIARDDDQYYHSLMSYYFSVQAYLYEPALQSMFSPNAFNSDSDYIPEYLAEAIENSTECCVLTLKHFLHLTQESIAIDPLFHSSRVIYTAGMLLRIRYLSISITALNQYKCMTEDTMNVIRSLTSLVYEASLKYPKNHFLNKMRLVLSLFAQTFLSQCKSAYKGLIHQKNDPTAESKHTMKPAPDPFALPYIVAPQKNGYSAIAPSMGISRVSPTATVSGLRTDPKVTPGPVNTLQGANGVPQMSFNGMQPQFQASPYGAGVPDPRSNIVPIDMHINIQDKVSIQSFPDPQQILNSYPNSEVSSGDDLEYQYWALNDEFWSNLFVNIDGRNNDQDMNNQFMYDSMNKF